MTFRPPPIRIVRGCSLAANRIQHPDGHTIRVVCAMPEYE